MDRAIERELSILDSDGSFYHPAKHHMRGLAVMGARQFEGDFELRTLAFARLDHLDARCRNAWQLSVRAFVKAKLRCH